ncbi:MULTISPECIES: polysaccharide deacetylase family protein [unclassified Rhizobium]|uniref:polysaccharide deacetylase family protein n=1 Tax=unclassified Rhizobium TaxID=2613769 RepID=UPI0006F4B224|nr:MULTISPECIES: polysaccharide deacetylase family protein [unclassified Rhizobium]KQV34735.1 polysaccharide deacetylase [Rhizobium sp. Root1212]KRD24069.1 polysaccharide deacetylase [Rhizobium sp. Root268]
MNRLAILIAAFVAAASAASAASRLSEPTLRIEPAGKGRAPQVALTFDACSGQTDMRILTTLVGNNIPATIFVTARWLKRNDGALAILKAHPDLFEIENHGAMHVPPVDRPVLIYGIAAAGSPEAVATEVEGGAEAMRARGFEPHWYRGATAKYTLSSIGEIRTLGFRIAGYSVNGDDGSLLSAKGVVKRYLSARDGDVIISHINQPTHAAGSGVAEGILALKAKGYRFVKLDDAIEDGSDGTVN